MGVEMHDAKPYKDIVRSENDANKIMKTTIDVASKGATAEARWKTKGCAPSRNGFIRRLPCSRHGSAPTRNRERNEKTHPLAVVDIGLKSVRPDFTK